MNIIKYIICALAVSSMMTSCYKELEISEDPYAGGKQPLGIVFSDDAPEPEIVSPGSVVVFKVRGVRSYLDKGLDFFINNEKAEIVESTDSTLSIRVPDYVSSGGASIHVQNQVFFGPRLEISGNISIDKSFNYIKGANGSILDYIPFQSGYLLVGSFSDYASALSTSNPINNMAYISQNGEYQYYNNFGLGSNGVISNIHKLANGKLMVAGGFNTFNRRIGMNNMTRLNSNGSLDTSIVELINVDPIAFPLRSYDTVATYNGGVLGFVNKVFVTNDPNRGELFTVIGSFENYAQYYYLRSTWDMKVIDMTKINQVVRLNSIGNIDSTYNFDPATKKSYVGGNGYINDGFLQDDGKLILVGDFTTFHQRPANRIVRLNDDGSFDESFNIAGANGSIFSIKKINRTGKYLVVGNFTTFNGKPANQMVRLNPDGSLDETLIVKSFSSGSPNYAYELQDGRIIVSGTFKKYDNITRGGFLVLNNDGTAGQVNNNVGAFAGQIYNIIETTSAFSHPAIIIMGYISKFDDIPVKNIVKVELKNLN